MDTENNVVKVGRWGWRQGIGGGGEGGEVGDICNSVTNFFLKVLSTPFLSSSNSFFLKKKDSIFKIGLPS